MYNKAYEYIKNSNNIVFFGGAGVSTESGIPDFRSKDGLYNTPQVGFEKYEPEYLLSHTCLVREPKVFFEFYKQKLDTRNIEPNAGHKYLAHLEEQGKLKAIVTQNIDGLHQKAGSKEVLEVHGTTMSAYCMNCEKEVPFDTIFNASGVPKCECGGMIRPRVTLYEEALPDEAWRKAALAISKADVLFVAGTSLTVYPAANLVSYFSGEHIIVVNKTPIMRGVLNPESDVFIQDSLGKVCEYFWNMEEK